MRIFSMDAQLFLMWCAVCILTGAILISIASRAAKASLEAKERKRGRLLQKEQRLKAIENAIATNAARLKHAENKLADALAKLSEALDKRKVRR